MSLALRITKQTLDRDQARREFLTRIMANEPVVAATSQCMSCKRHIEGTINCEAFPKGIPLGFLCGNYSHDHSFLGDNGLTFVPLAHN